MSKKRSRSNRVKKQKQIEKQQRKTRKEMRNWRYRLLWKNDPKMFEAYNESIVRDTIDNDFQRIEKIELPPEDNREWRSLTANKSDPKMDKDDGNDDPPWLGRSNYKIGWEGFGKIL